MLRDGFSVVEYPLINRCELAIKLYILEPRLKTVVIDVISLNLPRFDPQQSQNVGLRFRQCFNGLAPYGAFLFKFPLFLPLISR